MKWRSPAPLPTFTLLAVLFFGGIVLADDVYVSDFDINTIEKFDSAGHGTVFANTGLAGSAGLAFDSTGNLYVANAISNTIEVIDSSGHGKVFATTGLSEPWGLVYREGNLYVANYLSNTIEEFNALGHGKVFANTGLSGPTSLAFDSSGNLYVANANNSTIEKFNSSGAGTVFATNTAYVCGPDGLAIDSQDNLYVSNAGYGSTNSNAIVKLTPNRVVSVFASGLNQPAGLAFDSSGNLYEADYGSSTVKKFGANGSGSTFASSGLFGPVFIAVQVPEPASWALATLGGIALLGGCRSRHREL